jgi:hypothetical protein
MTYPKPSESKTCEEASIHSKTLYIPCGLPAIALVYHNRDNRTYHMCAMCRDHNIKRGGVCVIEQQCTLPFVPFSTQTLNPNMLEEDALQEQADRVNTLSLEEVVKLGEKLEEAYSRKDQQELVLKGIADEIYQIERISLPDALTQLGLKELTLSSGAKITAAELITAGISEENRPAAHQWLREHGFGDIIKNEVTTTFGKGEDEQALKLIELIKGSDIKCGSVEQKERVHPSTLSAFVKERVKSGEAFPLETFKVFIGNIAKIKKPKEIL